MLIKTTSIIPLNPHECPVKMGHSCMAIIIAQLKPYASY